jgi:hypothetical protein
MSAIDLLRSRLRDHVLNYAERAGQHPIETAAMLLAYYVELYASRETAVEHANRILTPRGLELLDHGLVSVKPPRTPRPETTKQESSHAV